MGRVDHRDDGGAEAKLAREAEIAYAMLATATDYDVWHESEADVTAAAVAEIVAQNVQSAQRIIADLAEHLPADWTSSADGRCLARS